MDTAALQRHPLVGIAIALIIGIWMADGCSNATIWWGGMAATLGIATAMLLANRWKTIQTVLLLAAVMFLGGWLMVRQQGAVRPQLPDGEQTYTAAVMSRPERHGKVLTCDLLVASGPLAGHMVKAAILRDTLSHRYQSIHVGDGLTVQSRFEHNSNYEGSRFDYRRWLECHHFVARTFIYYKNWKESTVSLKKVAAVDRLRLSALLLRERLTGRYQNSGLSGEEYGVVAAMTLGDKHAVDKDTRSVFQQTGAAHVLALSGLHLSVIYFFLSMVVGRRRRVGTILVLISGIWGFAFLTGLSVSIVRAAAMLTIYAAADIMQRSRQTLNTLALTVILLLAANPLSLWDVGFQLSVMAVLGIQLYQGWLLSLVSQKRRMECRPLNWAWSMVCVSVAAQLGVAPLAAHVFGNFPTYFLLTNFVAVPLTTGILFVGALFMLFSWWGWMSGMLATLLGMLVRMLQGALGWIATLPASTISDLQLNGIQTAACYVLIACMTGVGYYAIRIRRAHEHSLGVPSGN